MSISSSDDITCTRRTVDLNITREEEEEKTMGRRDANKFDARSMRTEVRVAEEERKKSIFFFFSLHFMIISSFAVVVPSPPFLRFYLLRCIFLQANVL